MIQYDIPYVPAKNIKPVNPEGWLDLKKAYVNGVVPGNLEMSEDASNGIEEASQVGSMPRDPFQAMRLKSVAKAAAKSKAPAGDTPSSGSEAK